MAQSGSYESTFTLKDKVSAKLDGISKKSEKVSKATKKAKVEVKGFQGVLQRLDGVLKGTSVQLEHYAKKTENIAKLGNKLKSIGQGLTVSVTLPVIAAGGAMVKLASDMEETMNKVDVSFGNNSDRVKEWAKTSIKSMGLAQQSALDSAALYGDMATGMGMSQDKAADMAMSLTQLGADLASFKNISNDVAQTALKSIFTGETESLKNLGVVMTEDNLKRFAMSRGIRKNIKDMSNQEKIQLRYNYVMEQTKNAHGDFIRTGGGAANQTRMFQEQLKELGVTFGQYILPYFTKAVIKLNEMLKGFNSLSPSTKKTILVLGAVLAVVGPLVTVIGSLITAVAGLNTVLMFLSANPVILIIAGITAGVWALIKAIQILVGWIKHLNRMKINDLNTNFDEGQLQKLSGLQASMGDKAFAKKYGKEVGKAVTNYRKNDNRSIMTNSNNTTNTYHNLFNISGRNSREFDILMAQYVTGNI